MNRPQVYTASKVFRAPMWCDLRATYPAIQFTSRWLDIIALDDDNVAMCERGWQHNIEDIQSSTHLVCYAEAGDPLSGTLLEIGGALTQNLPVYLIGSYDWKTWKHHHLVSLVSTLDLPFAPQHSVAAVLDRIQRGD